MNDTCKLSKLIDRLQRFSNHLDRTREFTVHQQIDHFYYMQKKAELIALGEQLDETRKRFFWLMELIDKEYVAVFIQWRRDIRWLHLYQMVREN